MHCSSGQVTTVSNISSGSTKVIPKGKEATVCVSLHPPGGVFLYQTFPFYYEILMGTVLSISFFDISQDNRGILGFRIVLCPWDCSVIGMVLIIFNSKLVIVSQMKIFLFKPQCCCWVAFIDFSQKLQSALHTGSLYSKLTNFVVSGDLMGSHLVLSTIGEEWLYRWFYNIR